MFQLRNRYNVEKRRVITMRGVTSTWPLFDSLQYLSDYNENRLHCTLVANATENGAPATSSSEAEDDDVDEEADEEHNGKNENNTSDRYAFLAFASVHFNSVFIVNRNGYITSDNIDLAQQTELLQHPESPTEESNYPMPVVTEMGNQQYMRKFEAFGQFLASSLIELNEMQALHLVKKFTTDLVEYSKLGEGNKISRTNMNHSAPDGEEEHFQEN